MATTVTSMTYDEHKDIYQAISESVVAEPDIPPDPPNPEGKPPKPKKQDLDWRALRGALHLDEHHPGWADKINLKTFSIEDVNQCVVGQVAGYYDDYAHKLFPVVGGYTQKAEDFGILPNQNTDELNYSWKILITERQRMSTERKRKEEVAS